MNKLLYLAAIFIIVIGISVYFLSESFTDTSGNVITDTSGNVIHDTSGNDLNKRLSDLISILTASKLEVEPQEDTSLTNRSRRYQTVNNDDTSISLSSFFESIKPQLSNDISAAVHDEFERSKVLPQGNRGQALSSSVQQGMAWQDGSDQPDMSQYVRKDSIPCWGCSGI